ncbi:hypothetical protein JDV02_010516 [Purpureocillium takamizusanense]|uniref:DUF2293 domain-containing protein n=1 Tax=Purpureocillium takamizusanense TaxID=2060973 RepID=A0A9Q8QQT3_9HYPO|nr:uncharacterized protein JDV02_010516 [Purpureocillium takamizusanense]UNI24793.1 hypothetical protein JDV02_010516 [Purpureocillium takamizusanense]
MGNNKRKTPAAVAGGPKERHKRAQRHANASLSPQPPPGLGAKRPLPQPKDKHHTYFEFVENKDRKKKLDCVNVSTYKPPQGYSYIPVGHPELTRLCKELSREQGVKIYIVSNCGLSGTPSFANQMSRMGFHFSSAIVDKAKEMLSLDDLSYPISGPSRAPEPIPESQAEYHAQADAVLRDLFPRIPNTDRQIIIDHAFTRRDRYKGEPPVGLSADMTLARRVQLAVLAHIRHSHTRYDELLKEMQWIDARRIVQSTCLDFLVKWRGDEETGRDQLEEILREVVVISDSEDEEESADEELSGPNPAALTGPQQPGFSTAATREPSSLSPSHPVAQPPTNNVRTTQRLQRRGFRRYAAVQVAWAAARERNREDQNQEPPQGAPASAEVPNVTTSHLPNEPRAPVSFSLPGRAPSSNGYVPHTVSQDVSAIRGQAPYAEVHRAARQPPLGTSAPRPPRGDSLRDLVVPSIEGPGYAVSGASSMSDDRFVFPPSHRGVGPYTEPVSVPVVHDGQHGFIAGPRSANDRLPFPRTSPRDYHAEGVLQHQMSGHDQGVHGTERRVEQSIPYPPRPYDTPRADGNSQTSGRPAPDRIVVNAAAPGNPSNPIVMEDRGGFYERVSVPEPAGLPSRRVTGVPARHRVVSGEEGSRILRETQGAPGVEIIPLSRPGNATHSMHPNSSLVADRGLGRPWEAAPHPAQGQPGYLDANHGYAPQPALGPYPPPSPHGYREE